MLKSNNNEGELQSSTYFTLITTQVDKEDIKPCQVSHKSCQIYACVLEGQTTH